MPEPQHEPLISSQTSVNMGQTERESTKRALKVAGFTVLACALIAGQALTAYFLLSQKSQISNLEDSANSMKDKLNNRQSGGSSGRMASMAVPMSHMSLMTDEDPKPILVRRSCLEQVLAAGPNGFHPQCNENGGFLPMQCQEEPKLCWCVTANGEMIPGTAKSGQVSCGGTPRGPSGRMAGMAVPMSHMSLMTDEEAKTKADE